MFSLYLATVFLIISITAAIVGFTALLQGTRVANIAQVCFWIFLGLFLLSLMIGILRNPRCDCMRDENL